MKNLRMNYKNIRGITLISLVVTIIILLILAGVTINMVLGENGIIKQATNAKEKTELAGLKEQVALEILAMQYDDIGGPKNLTVSEIVDILKEKNIINDDMTFKDNSNYSLSYSGYILDSEKNKVTEIDFQSSYSEGEYFPSNLTEYIVGTRHIKCVNGTFLSNDYRIVANEAPEGYKFAYWVDQDMRIFSYKSSFNIIAVCDMTLTSIYVKENVEIVPQNCVNIYSTSETQDGYLGFLVFYSLDTLNPIKEYYPGLLGTSNYKITNYDDFTVNIEYSGTDLYIKKGKVVVTGANCGTYTWTKSKVGSDVWYAKGYVTLTYEDGSTETIYSPNIVSAQK